MRATTAVEVSFEKAGEGLRTPGFEKMSMPTSAWNPLEDCSVGSSSIPPEKSLIVRIGVGMS